MNDILFIPKEELIKVEQLFGYENVKKRLFTFIDQTKVGVRQCLYLNKNKRVKYKVSYCPIFFYDEDIAEKEYKKVNEMEYNEWLSYINKSL